MSIERIVLAFAGIFILATVTLSQVHSIYWLGLTAFAGANLLQSAFTGFCPLTLVLKVFGAKPGQAFVNKVNLLDQRTGRRDVPVVLSAAAPSQDDCMWSLTRLLQNHPIRSCHDDKKRKACCYPVVAAC